MRGRIAALFILPVLAVFAGQPARAQPCPEPGLQLIRDMTTGRIPLSPAQFPAQADWQLFMHPASAILAFYYPPDWQAVPLQQMSAVGVLLRSPGGDAALQIYATPPSGPITSQQAAEMSLASLLGENARMQLLCGEDFQVPGLYPTTVTFAGVTDGGAIAATVSGVTYDGGNGAPLWVDTRSIVAPAQEFDDYLQYVFLPVFAQLQMSGGGGGGGGDDDDDDGDDDGGDDGGDDDGG